MPEDEQAEKVDDNGIVILLDNHMIQHFLGKDTAPHLQDILEEVATVGAKLGISQIVVYEALKAIIFDESKSNKVKHFLETYPTRYPVSEDVLVAAARVHELYGFDENTRNRRSGISTEDILIGATAMLIGAYVMTCDANDFPIPYFKENNRKYVYYEVKGQRKHLIIYLLQPDNEAIGAALTAADPALRKATEMPTSSEKSKK